MDSSRAAENDAQEKDIEMFDDGDDFCDEALPSETELVLLCLDYLRDLRKAYPPKLLEKVEGIDANYLTMACWALNKAVLAPLHLRAEEGNDAWFDKTKSSMTTMNSERKPSSPRFPDIKSMESEFLYQENPADEADENNANDDNLNLETYGWYEYDDTHPSNSHRFYPLAGLASGPTLRGSLSLGEVVAAGLTGLGARSRLEAERDMIQSSLFEQFVDAVQAKGFFEDPENDNQRTNPVEDHKREERQRLVYDERYRKVVAKFRTKLATKADAMTTGDLLAFSAADQQRRRRLARIQNITEFIPKEEHKDEFEVLRISPDRNHSVPAAYTISKSDSRLMLQEKSNTMMLESTDRESTANLQYNTMDLEEAEKLKNQGNVCMQRKEYKLAAESYTQALKLAPSGPNAHVYYSNRAAALVSMKKYHEAVLDSERSLTLKPDYGKAHARLGLAHFLIGNYRQAMEAYTVALKYEPDNKSSRNYLEKSAKRLAEVGEIPSKASIANSFSNVSEYEKSKASIQHGTSSPLRGIQTSTSSPMRGVSPVRESRSPTREGKSKLNDNDETPKIVARESRDEREAEKYKVRGNSLMASRDYVQALDAYSKAIEICSNGSQSHVYYSNRAAALCYLERYEDAEEDSLKSLALNPTYGKAHARLGLSRFFFHDYVGAVKAYTKALEHDPENAASKSYLAKAMARLESNRINHANVRRVPSTSSPGPNSPASDYRKATGAMHTPSNRSVHSSMEAS